MWRPSAACAGRSWRAGSRAWLDGLVRREEELETKNRNSEFC